MEEIVDVLNEFGCKTGVRKNKQEAHEKGLWHRVVIIGIVDEEKNILMQKRAHNKKQFPDTWDISAAGHVSAGETSLESGIREVKEEVGLTIKPEELTFITSFRDSVTHPSKVIENEYFDVFLLQVPKLKLEDFKMQQEELEDMDIFQLDTVLKLAESGKLAAKEEAYKAIKEYLER